MKFIVVQHMEWEGPGRHLLDFFDRSGINFEIIEAWHRPIPDLSSCTGLVVLGGSPNVDEEERYPYLVQLKDRIRECIASDKPYIGFCLGHQLLGHVLGAEVGPNIRKSIGFTEGTLTEEGKAHPLFKGLPETFHIFKWHGQAIKEPLPEGVNCLEGKPWVIGLQFDNHAADPYDVARWINGDREWIHDGTDIEEGHLLEEAERLEKLVRRHFHNMLENFFDFCMKIKGFELLNRGR